jgi:hypothetical protein
VFTHEIDLEMGDKEHQMELDKIHTPSKKAKKAKGPPKEPKPMSKEREDEVKKLLRTNRHPRDLLLRC